MLIRARLESFVQYRCSDMSLVKNSEYHIEYCQSSLSWGLKFKKGFSLKIGASKKDGHWKIPL